MATVTHIRWSVIRPSKSRVFAVYFKSRVLPVEPQAVTASVSGERGGAGGAFGGEVFAQEMSSPQALQVRCMLVRAMRRH